MGLLEDPNLAKATFFVLPWKGYHSQEELDKFVNELKGHVKNDSQKCLLALPYPLLEKQTALLSDPNFILGCSAMSNAMPGSFTESIAAKVLKQKNVRFVLIGSAENRELRKETNSHINQKIKKALANDLTPFFCIGESLHEMQEGKRTEILKKQCQEALAGLTLKEIARIAFVYEASWVQKTAELISMDKLIALYFSYRQVVAEVVGPKVFPKIRFIDPFPNDLENYSELLLAIRGKGLLISEPYLYTSLLNGLIPLDEFKYPAEEMEPFSDEGLEEEPAPFVEETVEEIVEEQQPIPEAPVEQVARQEIQTETIAIPSLKRESPPTAEKSQLETIPSEIPKNLVVEKTVSTKMTDEEIIEKLIKKAEIDTEQPVTTLSEEPPVAEKILTEVMLDEVLEEVTPVAPIEASEGEIPAYSEEILVEDVEELSTSDKKILEEPFSPIVSESPEIESEKLDVELPHADINALQEQHAEEDSSELEQKVKELNDLNQALAECYEDITKKGELLPKLRTAFPEKLSKMTADLNQLDPALQDEINRGNVAFFNENPDKAKEAGGVLRQLQELNFLLQESTAIPRDVDRLFSKGRELRKKLDASWTYFTKHRKEIKDANPNFVFPHPPSQLAVKEPVVELVPKDSGPSPLVGKRVAVVRTPPLKK